MRDLLREAMLEREIAELEEEIDRRKHLRAKKTFVVLYFILLLWCLFEGEFIDISCVDPVSVFNLIFVLTFGIAVAAVCIMLISYGVLAYIIRGAMQDEKNIARLKGELNAIQSTRKDV